MTLTTWSEVLQGSFQDIWLGVAGFLPKLVIALIIFIIGWVVAMVIDKAVSQIIKSVKLDSLLKTAKVEDALNKAGFELDSGAFVGGLVKWFIVIVFLVASLDVLGLTQVNIFLQQVVLLYLPQVIIAVLMLLVAVVIADAMQKLVVGAAKAAGITSANFLGSVTKWAIWIFALLAALLQLGIATQFIQTFFTGVIVALSLAFGLSFGLGGQDAAARYIEKFRGEIKRND
ncbi:MAG: hypothetical protein A2836_03290 [Candidatus Taylorbacteria bacterium RIFCSPHIGHO2_01_FULL_45_63]|uniref:Small-conductance mechanosensitive ion channel n=1 Tax=Candidatus Taylorbacteria bacterium RIFCSPHIGHO2_02_FULL_45_35 TaxID=1802311 RepID=A0A1G2MQX0_9BACT|nr:MAG: hypothetical protein A2836_03290 [Candidatus Taylorbacteria bacterium RIFCSPHIGHO2_01_FULL_45_63]OHA25402.1 MAG: hypothetical protein A3D56_01290 [Candidatus Taylorbacteria bacterium RIFCSPHIGHO2_02_FULL_45_35]OHA33588.1 MAG: hypothetical protein A3A22_03150 [Candidatus Taylorbacteria bacterium RIFCSPLOWO2_01_FULL_45_34b]